MISAGLGFRRSKRLVTETMAPERRPAPLGACLVLRCVRSPTRPPAKQGLLHRRPLPLCRVRPAPAAVPVLPKGTYHASCIVPIPHDFCFAYLRLRSPGPPGAALILLLLFGSASSSFRLICTCTALLRMRRPSSLYHPSLRWFVCFRLFLCGGAPRSAFRPLPSSPSKFSGTVPAGSL